MQNIRKRDDLSELERFFLNKYYQEAQAMVRKDYKDTGFVLLTNDPAVRIALDKLNRRNSPKIEY